jgi:hypothetical protein
MSPQSQEPFLANIPNHPKEGLWAPRTGLFSGGLSADHGDPALEPLLYQP